MMDMGHRLSLELLVVCRPVRIVPSMKTTDAILWPCFPVLDARMSITVEKVHTRKLSIELTLVILPPTALDKLSTSTPYSPI